MVAQWGRILVKLAMPVAMSGHADMLHSKFTAGQADHCNHCDNVNAAGKQPPSDEIQLLRAYLHRPLGALGPSLTKLKYYYHLVLGGDCNALLKACKALNILNPKCKLDGPRRDQSPFSGSPSSSK